MFQVRQLEYRFGSAFAFSGHSSQYSGFARPCDRPLGCTLADLSRRGSNSRTKPDYVRRDTVFLYAETTPDRTLMGRCFVIQPFDKGAYDKRYEDVIVPAIQQA